jgi:hypothetical protein
MVQKKRRHLRLACVWCVCDGAGDVGEQTELGIEAANAGLIVRPGLVLAHGGRGVPRVCQALHSVSTAGGAVWGRALARPLPPLAKLKRRAVREGAAPLTALRLLRLLLP